MLMVERGVPISPSQALSIPSEKKANETNDNRIAIQPMHTTQWLTFRDLLQCGKIPKVFFQGYYNLNRKLKYITASLFLSSGFSRNIVPVFNFDDASSLNPI